MQTATTPLARVRMRAQGVMGRLKQLLTSRVEGFDEAKIQQASPPLEQAINRLQQRTEEEPSEPLCASRGV